MLSMNVDKDGEAVPGEQCNTNGALFTMLVLSVMLIGLHCTCIHDCIEHTRT